MRLLRLCVSLYLLQALSVLSLFAQQPVVPASSIVPPMVKFTGVLTDLNGKPMTGITGVTFLLYQNSQGGAPLWMETQNVQPDSAGNYSVMLGSTTSQGLPMDVFAAGEARWLAVQPQGETEQPRTLLLSVPYALKAADAETIGGLPPSAFVLAAPVITGSSAPSAALAPISASSTTAVAPPVSGTGTTDFVPLWTDSAGTLGNSVLFQSGTGTTAKVGINTTTPSTTLDVKGTGTIRGVLTLPATGTAIAGKGFVSQPLSLVASSFNSSSSTAVSEYFNWESEPVGNNTTAPSASLNLLFGAGATKPVETGLHIANNGQITFATGQAFPGAGTVSSVALSAPTSDFTVTGSPVTTAGTLGFSWTVAPTNANTASAIVKRDATGSFSAGTITSTLGVTATGAAITTPGITGLGSFSGGNGVQGITQGATGQGVYGFSSATGLDSNGYGPDGVIGFSTSTFGAGVAGYNTSLYGTGVTATGGSYGVVGQGSLYGVEAEGIGNGTGLYAIGQEGMDVYGNPFEAIYATGGGPSGVGIASYGGYGGTSAGTYGGFFRGGNSASTTGGDGIYSEGGYGPSATGLAADFSGNVEVSGTLSKGGGSFKIDHPLDAANKYLYHSFVESPDMMNIYNGNVTTDAQGDAVVELPDWFETLNRDFRYQLTVIGQFAQAIIGSEIANRQFTIKTDKPSVKVSWQVTGIRQDAWANAHRIPVEEAKPDNERGFYLHPELFGQPKEKNVVWARHPELARLAKEHEQKAVPPKAAKR